MEDESKKSQSDLNKLKGIGELIATYARWGATVLGGACLLIYSNEIGQFPEGIDLGEGLAFYLMSAGFLIAYSLFALIVTAMGSTLIGGSAIVIERCRHKWGKRSSAASPKINFRTMLDFPVVAAGVLGLIIWIAYTISQPLKGFQFILLPLAQGVFVASTLQVQSRINTLEVGIVSGSESEGEREKKKRATKVLLSAMIAILVCCPLVLNPSHSSLVEAGFRIAQLRKENATVHVKQPWAERVELSVLEGEKSFLGDSYKKFSRVTVLLRSVGSKVVVELPQPGRPTERLAIPSSEIEIE